MNYNIESKFTKEEWEELKKKEVRSSILDYQSLLERIENIEKDLNFVPTFDYIRENILLKINNIEKKYDDLLTFKNIAIKNGDTKPHKCPVCEGKRKYESLQSEPPYVLHNLCDICEGKGIIWG